MPRPAGLVGLHRANRQGGGSEPAEVRPFRTGDRLRRINWKVSSRTGELHVTSTWADRDTDVLLLLDTEHRHRRQRRRRRPREQPRHRRAGGGRDRRALPAQRRPGRLLDLGRRVRDIRAGSGRRHLRRVLDALVVAEPSPAHNADLLRVRPVEAGAMVVAFSPLVGQHGRAHVLSLAQHGHIVIVVDTLPPDPPPVLSPWDALAQRVRTMERQADIDHLGRARRARRAVARAGHARRRPAQRQPARRRTEGAMSERPRSERGCSTARRCGGCRCCCGR